MLKKLVHAFSIPRLIKSFSYAFKGLIYVISNESNMQIHVVIACIVLLFGFFFQLSLIEWALITFAITGVWVAELFNSSLEQLVDLVSPDYNELAGRAKDIAAGAVTIASLGAVIIGLIVFLPKILVWCNIL